MLFHIQYLNFKHVLRLLFGLMHFIPKVREFRQAASAMLQSRGKADDMGTNLSADQRH